MEPWLKPLPQVESAFGGESVWSCCLFVEDFPVQWARETPGNNREIFGFSLIEGFVKYQLMTVGRLSPNSFPCPVDIVPGSINICHLLNKYHVPCTVLRALHALSHLPLTSTSWSNYWDREKKLRTGPSLPCKETVGSGFEPRSPFSKLELLTTGQHHLTLSFWLLAWEDCPGCGLQKQSQPCRGHAHKSREILCLERGKEGWFH